MAGHLRRSSLFGILALPVVMAACVLVALREDGTDAEPKETLAILFAIIAAYIVVLFVLQHLDISRAERGSVSAVLGRAGEIENPALLGEADLWAALATGPIGEEALRARREVWGTARASLRLASVVTLLIFLSVPPIYLFETFIPLFVGGGLIAVVALVKSVRLLGRGGDLDRAYEASSRAMAPLGLAVAERPEVTIEPKSVAPFRMGPGVHGALVLAGERRGREVTVRMSADGGPGSDLQLRAGVGEFEFRARDGRLKAADGAPAAIAEALRSVPNSPRWNGVRGRAEGGVIRIERRSRAGAAAGDWMLDLWLAERLAEAARAP